MENEVKEDCVIGYYLIVNALVTMTAYVGCTPAKRIRYLTFAHTG